MMKMLRHLHGETPGRAQLALTYAVAALGLMTGALAGDDTLEKVVFAILGADWLGGIVANATRSTRLFYARQPLRGAVLFVVLHLVEAAALLLIFGANALPLWLWAVLAAKLAVFIAGQMEERQRLA